SFDGDGRLVASSRDDPTLTSVAGPNPGSEAQPTRGPAVASVLSPTLRLPVVMISTAIQDEDGAHRGRIEAALGSSALAALVTGLRAGSAGNGRWVDSSGRDVSYQIIASQVLDPALG